MLHAIILAGGTGRRLGGVSKADIMLGERRLLDWVLAGARAHIDGTIVVVAPESVEVPAGVIRTLEDPPLGGPVAGIFAGLDAIARQPMTLEYTEETPTGPTLIGVLTCAAPGAGLALPRLRDSLLTARPGCDAMIGRDATGREQYLLGVYQAEALRRRRERWGDVHGASMHRFISALAISALDLPAHMTADCDTPEDLARLRRELRVSSRGQ